MTKLLWVFAATGGGIAVYATGRWIYELVQREREARTWKRFVQQMYADDWWRQEDTQR